MGTRVYSDGEEHSVKVEKQPRKGEFHVLMDGKEREVVVISKNESGFTFSVDNVPHEVVFSERTPTKFRIHVDGMPIEVAKLRDAVNISGDESTSIEEIKAELPGRIVKIFVEAGKKVDGGDPLFALESMKMEMTVESDSESIVEEVYVKEGDSVAVGTKIIRLSRIRKLD